METTFFIWPPRRPPRKARPVHSEVASLDSKETKALFTSNSRLAYDPAGYVLTC